MNAIKMERLALLAIVKENMAKHITAFAESVEDYKKLVLQFSTANLKLAKTGNLEDFKKLNLSLLHLYRTKIHTSVQFVCSNCL